MGISYIPTERRWAVEYEKTDYKTDYPTNLPTNLQKQERYWVQEWRLGKGGLYSLWVPKTRMVDDTDANNRNREENSRNATLNAEHSQLNQENSARNNAYNQTLATANSTKGGDYVAQRQLIKNIGNISSTLLNSLQANFKNFYQTEKLQQWNANLGAKPPYGQFDAAYYKNQYPDVAQAWANAVANDDLDVTGRYGSEGGFSLYHYTAHGQYEKRRANKEEDLAIAREYEEKPPTDRDLQDIRNLQLGVDLNTQTDRLLSVPAISKEWTKARNGDPYWDELGKKYYLDVNKKDDFAALFRLSQRPSDKQISFDYNANTGYGVTELEDAINQAVGEQAQVDVKRFGALTQNVLKDTIAEMTKAKQKEQMFDTLKGFSGFGEIIDINKTLSDSILGDTGVGGLLSFTSAGKAEESLLKNLQGITGVQNNVTYNWQQWFDSTLKDKYSKAQKLGYTTGQAEQLVNIDAGFAKNFIEKYLQPRFDESKSMNEFVDYLDVRQEEQNPFQTQDLVNAVKLVADMRSKQYLDSIQSQSSRKFDSNFYFDPYGDKARSDFYLEQKDNVLQDWQTAKSNPKALIDPSLPNLGTWEAQAYRFGIDLNNKDSFARMHYQVKGRALKYDAAEDIVNAGKIEDQIYTNILPALKAEAVKQGSIFGQFITPDEFADQMLAGLDPNDKGTWDEVLKRYGLTDFKGTVEELKEYIKNTLRTGTAEEIRSEIKYLNEKRQKPTQEILGLTYIERPEDYKNEMSKPQTELFKTFQSAGYQGTEDEFYQKFFPDLDRSEQTLLTKAGSNEALKTYGLDLSDPFASLGTIESFFDEPKPTTTSKTKTSSSGLDSYFKLGLGTDDEEEGYQKSKSGQQILGEFTSMFKGF